MPAVLQRWPLTLIEAVWKVPSTALVIRKGFDLPSRSIGKEHLPKCRVEKVVNILTTPFQSPSLTVILPMCHISIRRSLVIDIIAQLSIAKPSFEADFIFLEAHQVA